MSPKRFLSAVALALWAGGGCASILGVDSDDYADASALLCLCAKNPKSCAAEVEEAIGKDEELEKVTLTCLGEVEKPECGAVTVASCVFEAGYCVETTGKRCLVGEGGEPIVGCCEGLACENQKCCVGEGSPCSAPGDCCDSLECDGATCQPKGEANCGKFGVDCLAPTDCCSKNCLAVGQCGP